MKRKRNNSDSADLFAVSAVQSDSDTADAKMEDRAQATLISSPLVDGTKDWLTKRALTLGNMLSSERAAEYVACLRALAAFREEHEPEPLHEDVELRVCGEDADAFAVSAFKSDIRQLKEWGLITERIEKERLRGYRDNRRTKFRYRICDDAAAFVEWLAARRAYDLEPGGGDETGNLLDMQRSLVSELRRMLNRVDLQNLGYETAGDILFRVEQMSRHIDMTARALQELNLRLLDFGVADFSVDEAKLIVGELALFLERFGRRFGTLREDILRDVEEMRRECHRKRWNACAETMKAEASRFRHIASVKVPDSERILADVSLFYGAGGTLVSLMSRVGDSARKVWGKLNAKLRELERRNHRIEDIAKRLEEIATLDEDAVPHGWLTSLLEQANMKGDAQASPNGEKSLPPMPKKSSQKSSEKIVSWITPRNVGERPDVASIAEVKACRMREWMELKRIYPSNEGTILLGAGEYSQFGDFSNIMQTIEYVRLGNGERAKKLLFVEGRPAGNSTEVKINGSSLSFEDIELDRCGNEQQAHEKEDIIYEN